MKRTEVFKTMTVKNKCLVFIEMEYCWFYVSSQWFSAISFKRNRIRIIYYNICSILSFLILTVIAISPVIKELSISKTYSIYTGRVVEVHENNMLKSVYLTIEYESPLVTRKDTHACFYPMDGKILFGKKIRIGVSQKSNKVIVLP